MKASLAILIFVLFSGLVSYTIIAIIFAKTLYRYRSSYDPLMQNYIDPREPNTFLRQPRRFFHNPCSNDPCLQDKVVNWTLVTFIKSKTDYFKRRELLRRTWNSVTYMNGARFEAYYLMGRTSDPATIALLDEEEERYGDILQYNGPDDYDLMPHKVLAGMEWASRHLSEETLYASADDDFLINLDQMVDIVTEVVHRTKWQFATNASVIADSYLDILPIMCMFVKGEGEKPLRIRGLKWYVTYDEYRPSVYPPYCHGGMYVMSMPTATNLWNTSLTSPMLRLDDVWITGILRRRMNFSDDLVMKMPEVTKHFGTVNDGVRDSMSKKWAELYSSFENTTKCTCTL